MAVLEIHPIIIRGQWRNGIALDRHTTSSTYIGDNQFGHAEFDTVRPPIAERLYFLKYKGNVRAAPDIIDTAVNYLRPHRDCFDLLIPVPPSSARAVQPVLVLANGISAALNLPIANCISTTRPTAELKSVNDPAERQRLLHDLYAVNPAVTRGKSILLFDDLFRSGSTMNAITNLLMNEGEARQVQVLTITKTRSNQ